MVASYRGIVAEMVGLDVLVLASMATRIGGRPMTPRPFTQKETP